ncbi:MAG: ATP-dependent helicase HrpB [Proteobacteria bacterium]|nr:ATP-dependent helicase HrpB [Pseudomonadota bacterium]
MVKSGLPIDEALEPVRAALGTVGAAVLQAPPGAGKSTVVPLALLGEGWAAGKRLLLLEPRRLATRAIATRMAESIGERVGGTVGYRMRLESRVSRETRIEVITDGVLTRMLQADPALEQVAAVIFDEFHERSLQADLGLALTLDARTQLNPGLRVLVMSATLDGEPVAALLGNVPLISSPGRAFEVHTYFHGTGLPPLPAAARVADTAERRVTQMITRALRDDTGDILAFLPGAAEIRRVQSQLDSAALPRGTRVLPLFGDLTGARQDEALRPAAPGERKIVLATNIAETSLTIPGVRVVVDSGLVRRAVFDPVTGMSRLETQRISRASAEQRRGRAGRTQAGVCHRGWSEGAQTSLAAFTAPEIVAADLAPLALELASWGTQDARQLRWLDPPPEAMLASARSLLVRLDALAADGRILAHGREMARIGAHPRLAHMLLRARPLGQLRLAAQLAALLSERDLLRGDGARDADIRSRIEVMRGEGMPAALDRATLQRARHAARALEQQLGGGAAAAGDAGSAGLLLAFAYPDRIGRRRPGGEGRYTLANGRGAHFGEPQSLARQEFIVAVDLEDRDRDARILLAAPLDPAELFAHFAAQLVRGESVEWNSREQAVLARRTVTLDRLLLEEKPLAEVPREAARSAMLRGIGELGIVALSWDREARDLQARIGFVRAALAPEAAAEWPAVDDAVLAASTDAWLAPWLDGVTRREHLAKVPVAEALRALLRWEQARDLDAWAPTHLTVPSGSRIRIDYLDESAPAVSVRLQEVFGLASSPLLGRGRIPVTFKLLSPAQRPVQVTRDLAGFWRGSYAEVRKDMRGRYPKHYWPENPLEAQPTRGARRR